MSVWVKTGTFTTPGSGTTVISGDTEGLICVNRRSRNGVSVTDEQNQVAGKADACVWAARCGVFSDACCDI